jgi:hypothetical protein
MKGTWKGLLVALAALMGVIFLAEVGGIITYAVMLQSLITLLVAIVAVASLFSNIAIQTGKDKLAHVKEQLDRIYVPLKFIDEFMLDLNEHKTPLTQVRNTFTVIEQYYLLLAESDLRKYLEEYYILTRDKQNGYTVNSVRLNALLPLIKEQVKKDYEVIRNKYDSYVKD